MLAEMRQGREGGWLLVEAMVALTVLTVGILGFLFSFQANFRATRELGSRDLAEVALQGAVETLHAANFTTLYTTYNGVKLPATGLVAPDGTPATVLVQFDVNETTLPLEYGPVQDIDGDGVKTTTNASASYVLLPTRLTLNYQMSYGPETKTLYLVLAP
jgi:Tfp pilus assembly protein PilV